MALRQAHGRLSGEFFLRKSRPDASGCYHASEWPGIQPFDSHYTSIKPKLIWMARLTLARVPRSITPKRLISRCRVDSRFRGNDCAWEGSCFANDTGTQILLDRKHLLC